MIEKCEFLIQLYLKIILEEVMGRWVKGVKGKSLGPRMMAKRPRKATLGQSTRMVMTHLGLESFTYLEILAMVSRGLIAVAMVSRERTVRKQMEKWRELREKIREMPREARLGVVEETVKRS